MEQALAATNGAVEILMRKYTMMLYVLALVLAFALYVYFFPTSVDFFANPTPKEKKQEPSVQATGLRDDKVRAEPPENDPHANHTPVHE